jgi:hypothetical protein
MNKNGHCSSLSGRLDFKRLEPAVVLYFSGQLPRRRLAALGGTVESLP